MQQIWAAGLDWDENLAEELQDKWESRVTELSALAAFEVPRCLRRPRPKETHLHMFSDASGVAYAATAYLIVCIYEQGPPSLRLIASKCRVAPIRAMSIPRLELMGAVNSTRLAKCIANTLTAVSRTIFWTDSTNVLYWVRIQSRDFKTFVANRIGEIHLTSDPNQWRHVPGELNPAELATRGMTASELIADKT